MHPRLASAAFMAGLLVATLPVARACLANDAPIHETLRVDSRRVNEQRRINVYLPPGYDRCTDARFPVVYMLDGGEAEDFPHFAGAVDELVRASRIRPLIVVGLENTNRRRDVTGPTDDPADLEVTAEPGGADALRAFFRDELQPVVQSRYRTNGERALVGESLAGLFVVETLLTDPGLFDAYIALDPSLWWNKERLSANATALIAQWPAAVRPRLLIASADANGNLEFVERFVAALQQDDTTALTWRYEPHPHLRHDNIYRSLERPILESLFAPPVAMAAECGGTHQSGAPAS